MQEKQVLVKKENLAVYDKVSDKIFTVRRPRYFLLRRLTQMQGQHWCIFRVEFARRGIRILRGKI